MLRCWSQDGTKVLQAFLRCPPENLQHQRPKITPHIVRSLAWDFFTGDYRTAAGAEIDLILELPGGKTWAIEIKRGLAPKTERGFHEARDDLQPAASFVVYAGAERYPISQGVEAVSLRDLAKNLQQLKLRS